MNLELQAQTAAKTALRQALSSCQGDTKHDAVATAIEQLAQLNPTPAPARNHALMDGQWRLISAPSFPNRIETADGKYLYTLGRLAFNMFQPTDLKIAIDRVLQPVLPTGEGEQRTHDIIVEFTTVDPTGPALKGRVYNLGICKPIQDNILQVQFTGGCLEPQDQQQIAAWQARFGNQSRPVSQGLKQRFMTGLIQLMFGIVPPSGISDEGQVTFKMRRSPKGKLELLYLDEELRITRGERGTVLVCERISDPSSVSDCRSRL